MLGTVRRGAWAALALLLATAPAAAGPAAAAPPLAGAQAPAQAAKAEPRSEIAFSKLLTMGHEGRLGRVEYRRRAGTAEADAADGSRVSARTPGYESWIGDLAKAGVEVSVAEEPVGQAADWFVLALQILLPLLMVGFLVSYGLRATGRVGGVGKRVGAAARKTTFDDVAGAEQAKRDLMETVAFLKDPARFRALGARVPRGILLSGDPGNGKTLLARAVAGEAGVPFVHATGADFVEMYVGVGARRVRGMFRSAKRRRLRDRLRPWRASPATAILFIDEIDSVGQRRGGGNGGDGGREHDQTLNALLTEMDGLDGDAGVVVIAATNRPDVLDPALMRSGRFDRQVAVAAPEVGAREAILRIHARGVRLAGDVDLAAVAKGTPRFSGADLEALVNEAAIEAAREGADAVAARHFESARDAKLLGGAERGGTPLHPEEMETVCVHEAGHALAAVLQPECDPVHKATVIPRGRALGFVARIPERERLLVPRGKLLADIVVLMAGRAAEEECLGPAAVTGGAGGDIEEATRIARLMVEAHGMGESLASRSARSFDVSEATRRQVDEEVDRMLARAYAAARGLLSANRDALDALARALRERETLSGDEVRAVVAAHRAPPMLAAAE